ncbi:MAG: biotin/lipoyl-binding protein [Planctomycetota bacterium]|nr:biotin/lipoyl-binding protein [Planctomycetota bacterium]
MKYFVTSGERVLEVEVIERFGQLEVSVGGELLDLTYQEVDRLGQIVCTESGKTYGMSIEGDENQAWVTLAGHVYALEIEDERERAAQLAARAAGGRGGPLKAVMPGVVVQTLVAEGDTVVEGQPILVLEAMKMQNEIGAPCAGTIKKLAVAAGQAVGAGDLLAVLEATETA